MDRSPHRAGEAPHRRAGVLNRLWCLYGLVASRNLAYEDSSLNYPGQPLDLPKSSRCPRYRSITGPQQRYSRPRRARL